MGQGTGGVLSPTGFGWTSMTNKGLLNKHGEKYWTLLILNIDIRVIFKPLYAFKFSHTEITMVTTS